MGYGEPGHCLPWIKHCDLNELCLFFQKQVLYKLAYTESCKRDVASECAKR